MGELSRPEPATNFETRGIAIKDIGAGETDQRLAGFPIDFVLTHACVREATDRSRMDHTAEQSDADGAGRQVMENPCENTRKVPRKPSTARHNSPHWRDSP